MKRIDFTWWDLLAAAVAIAAVMLLFGCATTRSGTVRTHAVEVTKSQVPFTAADGSSALVAVVTTKETTSDQDSEEEQHSAPDVPAIVQAASPIASAISNVASGNWGALLGQAATLLTGTGVAAAAVRGRMRTLQDQVEHHKADATEGWAKADEHAARAEQYARQLPPKDAASAGT